MHKSYFKASKSANLVVLDGVVLIALLILMRDGDAYKTGKYEMARHSNFVRSMYGRYGRRSEAVLSCAHNESVCGALLEKGTVYTWSTCCWGKVCKDLREDAYHCGECGRACGYGMSCCNGACVDLNMDSHNCGRCGNVCPYQEECSFGMCDYAGVTLISPPPTTRGPKHR
ncbi:hypothetical protein L7F22_033352 [Adiantum nelumboides]|nr:hypothetical protein [Adiantum nelumboides]